MTPAELESTDFVEPAAVAVAFLGHLADLTSIGYVYRLCSFLPLIGLLTAFLPEVERRRGVH